MRDTERERGRDTGRGRSRLHAGSLRRTRFQISSIRPWAKGGAKPLSHPGCPEGRIVKNVLEKKNVLDIITLEDMHII